MKRSERMNSRARHAMGMAAVVFMVSIAMGVWSVRAAQSIPVLGWGMLALALTGFAMAADRLVEGFRLRRLSNVERRWEWEREVRPRL